MDGRDGLQLLPGTKKRLGIKVPGENKFLYIGSVIFGATLVSIFALSRYQLSLENQVNNLNDQLAALEQKRNKNDEAELVLTKDTLTLTADLIKDHRYWSQLFLWLEGILQSEIQIKGISVGLDGKLILSGVASDYIVVARQVSVFLTEDRITDLSVGEISPATDGNVEFSMELILDTDKIITK